MQNLRVKLNFYFISKIFVILSLLWCIFIGVYLWVTPLTSSESLEFSDISRFGVIPLVVPVFIVLVAVWATYSHRNIVLFIATTTMGVYWLISSFSIGIFYTPSLILLGCALTINLTVTLINRRKKV